MDIKFFIILFLSYLSMGHKMTSNEMKWNINLIFQKDVKWNEMNKGINLKIIHII